MSTFSYFSGFVWFNLLNSSRKRNWEICILSFNFSKGKWSCDSTSSHESFVSFLKIFGVHKSLNQTRVQHCFSSFIWLFFKYLVGKTWIASLKHCVDLCALYIIICSLAQVEMLSKEVCALNCEVLCGFGVPTESSCDRKCSVCCFICCLLTTLFTFSVGIYSCGWAL